jgi:hypothetical protein
MLDALRSHMLTGQQNHACYCFSYRICVLLLLLLLTWRYFQGWQVPACLSSAAARVAATQRQPMDPAATNT